MRPLASTSALLNATVSKLRLAASSVLCQLLLEPDHHVGLAKLQVVLNDMALGRPLHPSVAHLVPLALRTVHKTMSRPRAITRRECGCGLRTEGDAMKVLVGAGVGRVAWPRSSARAGSTFVADRSAPLAIRGVSFARNATRAASAAAGSSSPFADAAIGTALALLHRDIECVRPI